MAENEVHNLKEQLENFKVHSSKQTVNNNNTNINNNTSININTTSTNMKNNTSIKNTDDMNTNANGNMDTNLDDITHIDNEAVSIVSSSKISTDRSSIRGDENDSQENIVESSSPPPRSDSEVSWSLISDRFLSDHLVVLMMILSDHLVVLMMILLFWSSNISDRFLSDHLVVLMMILLFWSSNI